MDVNDKHDDFVTFEIHRAFGVATILLLVVNIRHAVLMVQRKSNAKHVHHGNDSDARILFAVGDDGVDRVMGGDPVPDFLSVLSSVYYFFSVLYPRQSGVHLIKTPQWVEAAVASIFGNPIIRAASNVTQPNEARRFVGRGRRLAD